MWSPPGPDEPTSEVYRVVSPRRNPGQVREALNALSRSGQVLDALNGIRPTADAVTEPVAKKSTEARLRDHGTGLGIHGARLYSRADRS